MQVADLTVIIKTSYNCNMDCQYCSEAHTPRQSVINLDTAYSLISKFGQYAKEKGNRITFIWHGGEPLLLGIDFYKEVARIQRSLGSGFIFRNQLQTNGVLITEEIADFFMHENFHVGVSLDGPKSIHDQQRSLHGGYPSFEKAYAGLEKIRRRNRKTGVLAVFTRNTLNHLDEFYEFFRNLSLSLKINPLLPVGKATEPDSGGLIISQQEYSDALIYLFNRWLTEPRYKFTIAPFSYIIDSFVTGKGRCCRTTGNCHNYLEMDPDGRIRPCGIHGDQYQMGNVRTDDVGDILQSVGRDRFISERSVAAERCCACKYFELCRGGCASSAYITSGSISNPDASCDANMRLYDHMLSSISGIISPAISISEDRSRNGVSAKS